MTRLRWLAFPLLLVVMLCVAPFGKAHCLGNWFDRWAGDSEP